MPMYVSQQTGCGFPADESDCLNAAVTYSEIQDAIRELKARKSSGSDRVLGEMIKCSATYFVPYLSKPFNDILDFGIFPRS